MIAKSIALPAEPGIVDRPATIATTPGGRRTWLLAAGLGLMLVAVSVLVLPIGSRPGPQIPAFLPIFSACVVIGDLLTGYLLYHQARLLGIGSLVILSGGYLFTGVTALLQLLVFPGIFTPDGLLGAGPQSAVWLWMLWHAGFAVYVILYSMQAGRERQGGAALTTRHLWYLPATLVLLLAIGLTVTLGRELLPVLIVGGQYGRSFEIGVAPAVLALNATAVILLLLRTRLGMVVQIWLAVAITASFLDAAVTLYAGTRFSIGWYVARADSLVAAALILLALQSETIRLYGEVVALNRRLSAIASVDGLTGVANRRHFDEVLAAENAHCARFGEPLSLLLLDVDYFKRYNDGLGHPAGDACLKLVAAAITQSIRRSGDLAARYGGEEFAVVASGTGAAAAEAIAARIRTALQDLAIPHPDGIGPFVTISIGIATAAPAQPASEAALLAAADAALYRAKAAGRDRAEATLMVGPSAYRPPAPRPA